MMTDESRLYQNLTRKGFKHEIVVHSNKEWVRGDVHTQGIDGFWGLVKRGVIGTFHQMSVKHLDRYIQEFSFRWNGRENQELFVITVACMALGIPLPYAKLVGDNPMVRNKKGVNQFTASAASPETDPDLPF
jgi:ISXO2-like transposase domain